jgi:VCBS repeat-containing protein
VEIGDNAFTYTPDENFNGSDGFGFEVSDGEFSVGASVSITVTPVNDPPVVTVGQVVVNEDATAQVIVTATDVDGDTLEYDITTAPTKGSVSPTTSDTGVFTYTPDPDLNGTDTFSVTVGDTTVEVTVTVDVSITAVADAPVADNATNSTIEDTAVGGTLTATDADGDALTYSLVTDAANGTAVVNADGSYTYIPGADFNGADSFTFKANDGGLDSNTATVSITVTPDNDAPVASDASFTTDENVPLSTFLPATDVDQGDILNFSITGPPSSGAVLIDDPATGAFTYTPGAWFAGVDTFTFTVTDTSDATATGVITVTVVDPVPNWDFIGFANPWRPDYMVNAGSAIPLKWYYTDPVTGDLVDSSTLPEPEPQLEIRITGYPNCDAAGTPITIIEDPGSSDLRYVDGDWQFNWDTVGLPVGCYELGIYHPVTNQLDRHSDRGDELDIELK